MSPGRRKGDLKTKVHDVVLWTEAVWVEGVEETQYVIYDSREDRIHRFMEQHLALQALKELQHKG